MQVHLFLVSCISFTNAYKILFYFAVDGRKDTQDMVKNNMDYAKSPGQGGADCCEVMLAHYEGSPETWADKAWYNENVVQHVVGPGYKFKHMRELFTKDSTQDMRWEDRYEFVWALDSDVDMRKMDLKTFFKNARDSGSHIVSPSFVGSSGMWRSYTLAEEQDNEKALEKQQIHVIGTPDDHCLYRHTTFAEMTATLMRPSVLSFLLDGSQCDHCIGDKAEWGLDRIWCSVTTAKTGNQRPCAYVDQTPLAHLDWQRAKVNSDFHYVELDVKKHHMKEWSPIRNVQCFPRPGMQPSNNADPLAGQIAIR